MIKINVSKNDLETFFDKFGNGNGGYKQKYRINLLKFIDFKKLFCSDKFDFHKDEQQDKYNKIYKSISSADGSIYKEIRRFVIDKFTEQIKFCPYCGKAPLIYFENGSDKINSYKRMFQFDHFFPKNSYQKGIINFYNLVPSCNACNHLKSDNNPFNLLEEGGKIFHPYFGWLSKKEDGSISAKNVDFDSNFNFVGTAVLLSLQGEHSKFFKLPQIYLNSQDTFTTFKFIQDKRSKMKAEKNNYIKNSLKTDTELKNYFFKNYFPKNEKDILKFANGKLKKDLIDNLHLKNK